MSLGLLYSLITAVLFVTLEPVSKLIAGEVSPYAITFWRFAIGLLILIPPAAVKIKKEKIRLTGKDILLTTVLGILFICVSMVALQVGVLKADSPSLIAILFSSNSIFTILFAILIVKEKLTGSKLVALILGVLGVVICADFSNGSNLMSVFLGVFAALSFSLYTVLSQKFMKKLGGIVQTMLVFFSGTVVLLVVLLVAGVDLLPQVQIGTVGILGYLGLLVTGVGYACYFKAIEKGGAIMASLAFFIKPVLTPFVTWIVNGITPKFTTFLAVGCIAVASYFAVYHEKRKAKRHPSV